VTTPEPCVICGATIPQTIPPRNRKTCSAACRYTLNRMRWQANREAAAERKREALEALPARFCESCGKEYKARNTARRTCGSKDCQKKQQAVYQQRKYAEAREQRVTAKVHTVRVKVTYTKTGVTRWEDRPLVPWTVSRTRDYKRRHEGVETAMLQARRDAAAVAAVLGEPDE
jgi:predicted nucleic acid-binding Zn ribbon protein